MSNELTPSEILQVDRVLAVMTLVGLGHYLKDALQMVGISTSTYYKYFAMAQEAKELLARTRTELERIEYADIVMAKGAVLRKVIEDGMDSKTFPADRLAIMQYLDVKLEHLAQKHRPADASADFLQGPALAPGTSTHRDVTIEVEGVKINVSGGRMEILDGEFLDDQE